MNLSSIIKEFQNLFYPRYCLICHSKLITYEEEICLQCLHKLPRTNNYLETHNNIEDRLWGRFPFERIASFCFYIKGGMLPPLIHNLKYNNGKNVGILLGKIYGKDLLDSDFVNTIDFIVPVPLHPDKEKLRGYNQSEMIAKGLSQSMGIPLSNDNLQRTISNPTQTDRGKTQRWENVKGIFELKEPSKYSGRHILLVDDVITTGSTIEACVSALTQSPEIKISVVALGEAV